MGMYRHNYQQKLPELLWYYNKSDNIWYEVIWYVHKKQFIIIYITVPMTYVYGLYYLSTYWYTYGTRMTNWSDYNICQLSTPHMSYKYWKLEVDASINHIRYNYNLILCHILHIRNAYVCGTQHKITTNLFLQ